MIAALIIWSYLGILLYLYGAGAAALLERRAVGSANAWGAWQPGLPVVLLLGLVMFGTLAAFLSLLMPLGLLAAVLLAAGALLLFVATRPAWRGELSLPPRAHWPALALMLLAGLIAWVNATGLPSNPDTNLYHAQSIHWAEALRVVPGLGNLNGRLAYNSDWLVINAAASFAFLGLRSFHLVPGLLFMIAVLYFAEGLFGLSRAPAAFSNWLKLLFLPLAFHTLAGEISSPGTDLPVILLTWALMALAAAHLERDATEAGPSLAELVVLGVLPAFIVTLKLSAAPLMLLSVYAFVKLLGERQPRLATFVAGAVTVVLLPWLIRSVVLSGYLVFPISQIDLFSFDWKVPTDYVNSVRDGVVGWARLPGKDWKEAVQMPLGAWLPAWFGEQTLTQRLTILVALLSPAALVLRGMRRYAAPLLVNYAGILFWLFSAPNLRFGYSFLLAGVAFIAAAVLVVLVERLNGLAARSVPLLAGAAVALFLLFTLATGLDLRGLPARLLLPADYRGFRTKACSVGDLQIACAAAYKQCGYEPFPCVPNVPGEVRPRGSGLQDGFYSTGK